MKKKLNRQTSILSILGKLVLLIGGVSLILLGVMLNNLSKVKEVAYTYMLNTAKLFMEDIETDIEMVTSEIFYRGINDTCFNRLPQEVTVENVELSVLDEIYTENIALRTRYGKEYMFFVYNRKCDFLVCDANVYYKGGYESSFVSQLRPWLKRHEGKKWLWKCIYIDENPYLLSVYVENENMHMFGYCVDLKILLEGLEINNMGYQMIPYIRWNNGVLIVSDSYTDYLGKEEGLVIPERYFALMDNMTYGVSIRNLFDVEVVMMPKDGVLEDIVNMQMVLLMLCAIFFAVIGCAGAYLYLKVIRPMRQFVVSLQNPEVELMLNNTENFDVVELEAAGKEFRDLLRRIKTLKIAIYEKDIAAQQVQTVYLLEQMQSHFYLNCLSILHSMAEENHNGAMTRFLKLLSSYMRYVESDAHEMKSIREEIEHIQNYIEIQQIRYQNVLVFEKDIDDELLDCNVPTLLLQTFVENAVKHARVTDRKLVISLFVTKEKMEDGEYLYITISDNGKGFRQEMLEAIAGNQPIYYEDRKHVGIVNAKQRVHMLYGEKGRVNLSNMAKGYGAVVELTLPLIREEKVEYENSDCG